MLSGGTGNSSWRLLTKALGGSSCMLLLGGGLLLLLLDKSSLLLLLLMCLSHLLLLLLLLHHGLGLGHTSASLGLSMLLSLLLGYRLRLLLGLRLLEVLLLGRNTLCGDSTCWGLELGLRGARHCSRCTSNGLPQGS